MLAFDTPLACFVDALDTHAYFTIRQASKDAWRMLHSEDYGGPVMQGRVRDYLGAAEEN